MSAEFTRYEDWDLERQAQETKRPMIPSVEPTELIFNTEFIFPLISDIRLKGVVFFDAGNAYEDFNNFGELRYTAGLGLRWISPVGPVRIEWGYNLDKKQGRSPANLSLRSDHFFNA